MKFIKENIVTILCIGILIVVTFIEFDTYRARILFVSTLMFFIGGMVFVISISRHIFHHRFGAKEIINRLKYEIIFWIISAILLLYLGGLRYTGAFFLGLSIYTVFALGYHWIKFGRKKEKEDA